MTASIGAAATFAANPWRVARWAAAVALLLVPLVMMKLSDDWHWTIGDFVVAGVMIGGSLFLYELATARSGSRAHRAGIALSLAICFVSVWAIFVRDDGTGTGYFMVVLAAMVGAFAVGFRAAGMARAAMGIAVMQVLLGLSIATAPDTAHLPGGAARPLIAGAFFAILWLVAAALFHVAARRDREGWRAPAERG